MSPKQILLVLKLRWWLILGCLALALAAAAAYLWKAKFTYVARTQVIVDLKTDPLLTALAPALGAPGYLATQVEILQSERLAGRVVRMMGLAQSPAAVARWREATEARIPLETFYALVLQDGLKAEASNRGSQILTLSFVAEDPNFAAAAVNAFAKAYIDLSVELRAGPAKENAAFFEERLKALRGELEAAQNKVAAFQRARGVVISNERYDQEIARLASLETSYAAALAEQAATSSVARNSGESSADVSQNPAVVSLRSQLAAAEARLAEASLTLGASHPARIQLEAQIKELRDQLARETRLVSGTSASVNRVASAKLGELRSLVEAQKRTIVNMRTVRDEGALLLKELEAAQRAFDTVSQRRSQVSLESQADTAGARVLTPAVAPMEPTSPKPPLILVAAVIGGLTLGIAGAIGWEMLDRRVRSAEDLAVAEGVPVLGILSSKPGKALPRIGPGMLPAPSAPAAPRLTMSEGS
ncbi:MAG: chain length determinant protein EpsF [Rubrivivax sp.]|nr:chain length determinant protein EpsF [Rubrivivax sp.]